MLEVTGKVAAFKEMKNEKSGKYSKLVQVEGMRHDGFKDLMTIKDMSNGQYKVGQDIRLAVSFNVFEGKVGFTHWGSGNGNGNGKDKEKPFV